ncbi:class I SAM-dependent methyltransferase [Candidatus Giovannonibacteria bacterium]|nr:class I SAM-dependent methyltransferase [Candidatus Giovannonibacteria bacterium]
MIMRRVKHGKWLGKPIVKFPEDLMVLQEIIWETRPDTIIECGTKYGGSALLMASILDQISKGKIITIDNKNRGELKHPRINYITGNSLEQDIRPDGETMVVLDSDHSYTHVLHELEKYAPMVTKGQYLIVEDTTYSSQYEGGGPAKAVSEFLKNHKEFEIDRNREKFLITMNRGGYLKRLNI